MIRHHPDDSLLLRHAGGNLAAGQALLVATHLERCAACRQATRRFESIGGSLVLDEVPAELPRGTFEAVMARIDAPRPPPTQPAVSRHPSLPPGMNWPRSLRHCRISRWRPVAPGMRWSRVKLADAPHANVFLLRIAAGSCMPVHTHSGEELTQVLFGSFDDGRAVFMAGDFDCTDSTVRHQPVVRADSECICLASVDGRLVHDGVIARWIGALIGI
ncbi:ChrR family anti-sigma-E factor [Scleromatobacter humisilvae]|uniref:ChrR family anti-sigma-E factor n=1 Tax=Scleromatobacter humisilvae TaxID=2897159 RepID=A0A9X1YNN6_9BURK|nr:ChrR family anti-sigma-E factor [Scleromatobacter humisilvae]MCK9689381.1 ChrR family anti-sigma-E factor [Scleromatobacter humisilvae]